MRHGEMPIAKQLNTTRGAARRESRHEAPRHGSQRDEHLAAG